MSEGALHPDSKALMGCWRALNSEQAVNVGNVGAALDTHGLVNRMFLIQRTDATHMTFRLAGADVTALFGRELRDHDFAALWIESHRALVRGVLESALGAPGPACLRATGIGITGRGQAFEIVFLPLVDDGRVPNRLLGLMQPLGRRPTVPRPIRALQATAIFPASPADAPRGGLRLVSSRD